MAQVRLNPLSALFHLLRNDAHKLETDPKTQWKFHRRMSWYWVLNFPVVGYLYFFEPHLWITVGLLLNTFYSLYANFATEYGAIPAAYAAMNTEKMANNAEIQDEKIANAVNEVDDSVDDIQDNTHELVQNLFA